MGSSGTGRRAEDESSPPRDALLADGAGVERQRRFERVYFAGSLFRGYALVEAARAVDQSQPRPGGLPGGLRFPVIVAGTDWERLLALAASDRRRRGDRAVTRQLVILDREFLGHDVARIADQARERLPGVAILLMVAESEGRLSTMQVAERGRVDLVGAWGGAVEDLAALIWLMQDERSAEADLRRGIPALVLIEDEPGLYAMFLPMIFRELLVRTRELVPPGVPVDTLWRFLDHRPRVLLAETYEQGLLILGRYAPYLIGVIADLQFPVGSEVRPDAGLRFGEAARVLRPTLPLIVQSNAMQPPAGIDDLAAFYLSKSSEDWLPELRRIMLDFFGFGDFVFRDMHGVELGRAQDVRTLRDQLRTIPLESFVFHTRRNHLSTWLYIHGAHELARRLRPLRGEDERTRARAVRMMGDYLRAAAALAPSLQGEVHW